MDNLLGNVVHCKKKKKGKKKISTGDIGSRVEAQLTHDVHSSKLRPDLREETDVSAV